VIDAPQSSPPPSRLPAAALILLLSASALAAQAPVRLTQEARFYKAPRTTALGTLLPGLEIRPGRTSGGAVEVAFEGWIPTRSLGTFSRDGFDAVVSRRPSETLHATAGGATVARLQTGVGFVKGETSGTWTRVRRTAWIDVKLLPPPSTTPESYAADRAELGQRAPLAIVPEGAAIGSVDSGTGARVIARSGGWSRVQVEAWVPDSVLRPAEAGVLVGVSQAEVRANPSRYVGRVVEWRLQFVAIQKADELRPEIPLGQSYLLMRGPLPEPGFVYVMVPQNQVARYQQVPALKELTLRGVIRAATTRYLPTPVLELVAVMSGLGE